MPLNRTFRYLQQLVDFYLDIGGDRGHCNSEPSCVVVKREAGSALQLMGIVAGIVINHILHIPLEARRVQYRLICVEAPLPVNTVDERWNAVIGR